MAQSYSRLYVHLVWGTKYRRPLIDEEIESELYAYIGGICRSKRAIPLRINGMPDHIHILCTLPRDLTVAALVRFIKANSSKWIKEKWPNRNHFKWQGGYGVFSVDHHNVAKIVRYIENQKNHHRQKDSLRSYADEFTQLLEEHDIEYDPTYLFVEY